MRTNITSLFAAPFICLLVGLPLFTAESRGQSIQALDWGSSVDGLAISLSTVELGKTDRPDLQVAFRNAGDHDMTLNLGSMLANGKVQLPDNIRLDFTDAEGKTRTFRFADKTHAGVAGRVDDYIVPIRAGSIYSVRLGLDEFWCSETEEFQVKLLPGRNRFVARFEGSGAKIRNLDMQSIKLMNFWLGEVRSNTLVVDK